MTGLALQVLSDLAAACAKLLKEKGVVGKANNGLIGVWERANDQGAWEMGFQVEADLATALKGKAVYIVGADPVAMTRNWRRHLKARSSLWCRM